MRLLTKKRYTAKKKTSKIHRLRNHPFIVPVTMFLMFFFLSIFLVISMGGQTIGPSDSKVVLLHVDGKQQVIPTRAKTVKELLNRLSIKLEEKDIVEPALDTQIFKSGFTVNVYKARTVLVEDESTSKVIYTAEPTPHRIARKAGIEVYPEDKITKVAIDIIEPVQAIKEGVIAERIVIDHAVLVYLNLYGKSYSIRTHALDVNELLAEKDIKSLEGDTIQPDPGTLISPNLQVFVIRHGKQIASREEIIEPPLERKEDAGAAVGSIVVLEAGRPGKRVVTYEIELQNGQEVSRREIQSVIIEQPVKRVIKVGTKTNTFSGSFEAALAALRRCESGGNYANKSNPRYRGAYQFAYSTWNNYGGYYDPADAPPIVQDQKTWETYQRRGWQPWPSCSSKLGLQDTYR